VCGIEIYGLYKGEIVYESGRTDMLQLSDLQEEAGQKEKQRSRKTNNHYDGGLRWRRKF
jgi:hypothetical protein